MMKCLWLCFPRMMLNYAEGSHQVKYLGLPQLCNHAHLKCYFGFIMLIRLSECEIFHTRVHMNRHVNRKRKAELCVAEHLTRQGLIIFLVVVMKQTNAEESELHLFSPE